MAEEGQLRYLCIVVSFLFSLLFTIIMPSCSSFSSSSSCSKSQPPLSDNKHLIIHTLRTSTSSSAYLLLLSQLRPIFRREPFISRLNPRTNNKSCLQNVRNAAILTLQHSPSLRNAHCPFDAATNTSYSPLAIHTCFSDASFFRLLEIDQLQHSRAIVFKLK